MVLSDRYGGKPRPSLLKQTLRYVAIFGFGALLLSALLGLVTTSIAETILPPSKARTPSKSRPGKKSYKGSSKAQPDRANEGSISP
ncbi:MAG: hypothetical protein VB934_20240 [Polyangiaceae bacterium]